MNKNLELNSALAYIKNKSKVAAVDALAASSKKVGIETTQQNWKVLQVSIEAAIDQAVNDSHNAFASLLK
tara:strand:+ start:513 stop:722 length:210 start_codon:yes stop_codon:yes gene_type:complete